MNRWYVLYTKPNAEYRVEAMLQERGIETYLPEITFSKDKKITRSPFFSCYLFMKVNLETVDYRKWKWLSGVRHVVSYGGKPVTLPDFTVQLIREKLGGLDASRRERKVYDFERGDTVRITKGPLRDMLAVFDRPTTSSQRVQVLLAVLGSVKKVRLDIANLEKSPDARQQSTNKSRRTRGRGRYIRDNSQQGIDSP